MGYEYIRQPQVFTRPISALGGIYPNTLLPYYYTSFESWTSASNVDATIWPIPRAFRILDIPGSFIVTQGGVVQSPTKYRINKDFRYIEFFQPVPATIPVEVTQIGTTVLTSTTFEELTANKFVVNSRTNDDAIRILKTGGGNAIQLYQPLDNQTPFTLNRTGQILMGSYVGTPVYFNRWNNDQNIIIASGGNPGISIVQTDDSANSGVLTLNKSRGSTLGGIGSVFPGDNLGIINFGAADGVVQFRTSARITASIEAIENIVTPGVVPGVIQFSTTSTTGQFAERMRINSFGRVGIGTGFPQGRLDITENSALPALFIQQTGTGDLIRAFDSGGEDITPFVITSAGRIGFGTDQPKYKLHLEGSTSSDAWIYQRSTTTGQPRILQAMGRDFPYESEGNTGIYSYDESNDFTGDIRSTHDIRFYKDSMPDNFTYFTITSSAGTTFPIGGTKLLANNSEGNYIVTVGGLVQPVEEYQINGVTRRIIFNETINANAPILIRQLVAPELSSNFILPLTSWTFTSGKDDLIYNFPSDASLVQDDDAYVVSVNGVIQTPSKYDVDNSPKRITFVDMPSSGFAITVTRLPSAEAPLSNFTDARTMTPFYTWVTSSAVDTYEFYLGGSFDMLLEEDGYYVTVGGVLQNPTKYFTDAYDKTIRFSDPVPADAEVLVIQTSAPVYNFNYSTRMFVNEGNSDANPTERLRITSKGAGYVNLNAGLGVRETGGNAAMGTATLNGTTAVTIANTRVTNSSRIFLTIQDPDGTPGAPYVSNRVSGVSFSIKSTSGSDTSTVAWHIIEPATF
jgi:hypothetical protein